MGFSLRGVKKTSRIQGRVPLFHCHYRLYLRRGFRFTIIYQMTSGGVYTVGHKNVPLYVGS